MAYTLSESRLASLAATVITKAFISFQDGFKSITRRARQQFQDCSWREMQKDATERLEFRGKILDQVLIRIRDMLGDRVQDKIVWVSIKAVYSSMIADRDDWEIAETFYNSVTRRIFSTVGVDRQIEFVDTDFDHPPTPSYVPVFQSYNANGSIPQLIINILEDVHFDIPYQDIARDAHLVAERIVVELGSPEASPLVTTAQMIRRVFYRGRGAYLVGKLFSGEAVFPFILALKNSGKGIYVDAALFTESEVSILFSFARSYFHVEIDRPYDIVRFLHSIIPRKRIAELYISIGYHKHGKTELYRDFLKHLAQTNDRFEIAPGERGMVMLVFHLPSYEAVFKIIRDNFDAAKRGTTRRGVMAKYNLVFKHDRAGRLIDAQEFEHLAFDRARFSEDLLQEIQAKAAGMVHVDDQRVVIRHLYVERRVEPLNLFIRQSDPAAAHRAIVDYGRAIRDLAAANIFTGDLLLKNFGVTRHERVISYDYDELCLVTDLNFRTLPQARNDEEEFAAEPWFHVADNDIFPEEFEKWSGLPARLKQIFLNRHGDLFDVEFWKGIQARLLAGEVIDILPYTRSRQLDRNAAGDAKERIDHGLES